ncbi:IS3 family transposase [Flavobacterium sp. S87F.05.LMB.W.Kidney.N]|uniref:IS3 family transposase n=1 Tax=Flavobacterium sp. S87F.05.LMB.W.Kidney.N TaxID=1278758 RepID=UPI0010659F50|nr:IS3 family transposase [Flavobacterium sp. S87F.05.LMB.W.Kidney.N]TDX11231.1 transposase InsO family protein [Flavobacterium sp. S87F.05.LMB.W.Kidney.N]
MENTRKKWPLEFKICAVTISNQYRSVLTVAQELGISKNSLQHWKKLYKEGKLTLEKKSDLDADQKEIIRLKKEIKNIQIEKDILESSTGIILQKRRLRYKFIMENCDKFPIIKMCKIFKVDSSCFYRWRKDLPTSRAERKIFITSEILRIYHWSQGRYGSIRVTKELSAIGINVSRTYVGKIMLENHLQRVAKLKFKRTTISSPKYPADNLLNQEFKVRNQSQVWVSDITYIQTKKGWIYLTAVIDLFDRKVIGWSISKTMKAIDTTIAAFKQALRNRPLIRNQKLIFHSDRGIQYACKAFVYILSKSNQITQSMSRKGNCYDNAVAESFFKTIKSELIYQNQYTSIKKAKTSVTNYIKNFYNTCRRHSALEYLTIEEFQKQLSSVKSN